MTMRTFTYHKNKTLVRLKNKKTQSDLTKKSQKRKSVYDNNDRKRKKFSFY